MATEQQQAPGADNEPAPQNQPNPDAEPAGGEPNGGDNGGADEPSPYDDLAQSLGWVPKAEYTGPPENWKPAEQYLRDGRDIQRAQANELKTIRAQLDAISRTSASIVEQQVKERTAELTDRFTKAVDEGDTLEAFKLSKEITGLTAQPNPAQAGPSPEAASWAEQNASWFQKDPRATARAIAVCNELAVAGYPHATQLAEAEKAVRQEFPHLFQGQGFNGKAPAGVNGPAGRGGGPKPSRETFEAMPKEAQDVANDMVARGVIKDRDSYVKNYFANLKQKA